MGDVSAQDCVYYTTIDPSQELQGMKALQDIGIKKICYLGTKPKPRPPMYGMPGVNQRYAGITDEKAAEQAQINMRALGIKMWEYDCGKARMNELWNEMYGLKKEAEPESQVFGWLLQVIAALILYAFWLLLR